ncbi:MAG: hypothetical protein RLO50_18790 [Azospirillaceae bacterium]
MPDPLTAILLATVAGLATPAAAPPAMVARIRPRWPERRSRQVAIVG